MMSSCRRTTHDRMIREKLKLRVHTLPSMGRMSKHKHTNISVTRICSFPVRRMKMQSDIRRLDNGKYKSTEAV